MFHLLKSFRLKKIKQLGNSPIIFIILILWYISSAYLYFELPLKPDLTWNDSLWWSVVTMTTVGYGDYFPISTGGRYLAAIPAMLFGIGLLGIVISEFSVFIIDFNLRSVKGMLKINDKNHILIINFTSFEEITKLIEELKSDESTKDSPICIIDEYMEEIPKNLVKKWSLKFVKGNPTQEKVLTQANLDKASHAIILAKNRNDFHSDDQNLATLLVIEKLSSKVFSVIEILDKDKIQQFEFAGADSVICSSEITSNLIIQELQDPGVKTIFNELTSNQYGHQIYTIPIVTKINKNFSDIKDYCESQNATLIGLMRNNKPLFNCKLDEKIEQGDMAVIIALDRINEI